MLSSLERSQTVEQSERDDSARQAEIVINKKKEIEAKLTKINQCLLNFRTDPIENINQLTSLLGELLGASCTLYSFLDNEGFVQYDSGKRRHPNKPTHNKIRSI